MPKATLPSGDLVELTNCYIQSPGGTITMKILPEISDSKSAAYNDEAIMGRAAPLKTYSHSENRSISWTAHFMVITADDIVANLSALKLIESLVYPQDKNAIAPYIPPPICQLQCGSMLASTEAGDPFSVCAILKSYSVKFPTDVACDSRTYLPYKFDVDMTWEVLYDSSNLPDKIE